MVDDADGDRIAAAVPAAHAAPPALADTRALATFFDEVRHLARETGLFALQLATVAARDGADGEAAAVAVDGLGLCTREMRDVLTRAARQDSRLASLRHDAAGASPAPQAVFRAAVGIARDIAAALDEMAHATERVAYTLAAASQRAGDDGARPVRVDLVALERRARSLAERRSRLHARLAQLCARLGGA